VTAPVWQRGILESEYGVPYDSVKYVTGAIEPSAEPRKEKIKLDLAPSVSITSIGQGKCLSQMLADGEIDAIYSAYVPSLATQPPLKLEFHL
jgi:4,5-dihydroxyphthalate decarboxylase